VDPTLDECFGRGGIGVVVLVLVLFPSESGVNLEWFSGGSGAKGGNKGKGKRVISHYFPIFHCLFVQFLRVV